jgi:hypothetical protein
MRTTPLRALLPTLAVLAVALAGCSGDHGADGTAGSSAGSAAGSTAGSTAKAPAAANDLAGSADSLRSVPAAKDQPTPISQPQALIRRGDVELTAGDVGKAQFEVQRVVDRYGGEVSEERTTTGDNAKPAYTRMVLRIPSADFDRAMEALKGLEGADLESADTSSDDVTRKVIDVRTRLQVQRQSIARITALFDRARSIRDVMAIEAQLATRQAELESLERQAAYLANQTSLSTITVSIDATPATKAAPKEATGFLAGLSAGWHTLVATAVALATVAGALLPWLVVLALLGPLALLLARAVRRRLGAAAAQRG